MLSAVGQNQKAKQIKGKAIKTLKVLKFQNQIRQNSEVDFQTLEFQNFITDELLDYFIRCWKEAVYDPSVQAYFKDSIQAKFFLACQWGGNNFEYISDNLAYSLYNEGYIVETEDGRITVTPTLLMVHGCEVYVCFLIQKEHSEGIEVYIVNYTQHEIYSLMIFDLHPGLGDGMELAVLE